MMPDLTEVLAAHLAHLRLLGRSERTVYDRERAVIRLAAWLAGYAENAGCEIGKLPDRVHAAGEPGSTFADAHDPAAPPLLHATAADLAAWRASLTVGDQAVVVYCAHVAGFYDFAVTRGIRPDNPATCAQ